MSIQKKQNRNFSVTKVIMNSLVFGALCNIQNGSITIIKQDNIVIQINVNERIIFDKQIKTEEITREAMV